MEDTNSFEFLNLNEIDPEFQPIEPGFYKLQIREFKQKQYNYKPDDKEVLSGNAVAGDKKGEYISYRTTIVDDETFAGRSVRGSLFPSTATAKALRRIADATGIQQEDGATFTEWLEALEREKPVVSAMVTVKPDRRNPEIADVSVNWFEVRPA